MFGAMGVLLPVLAVSTGKREVGAGAVACRTHVAAIKVAVTAHEHLAAAFPRAWQDPVEHVGRAITVRAGVVLQAVTSP